MAAGALDAVRDPGNGPKRLLSIDGGGLRGVLAAEVLVELERQATAIDPRRPRLADHFHLIGGTSTGSILAAGLALGVPAVRLRDFYLERGPEVFRRVCLLRWPWHRHGRAALLRGLSDLLGEDVTLGDPRLATLLLVVAKNVSTGEPWFFVNNPAGTFYAANRGLRLATLVRASCAAPTFFPPERIEVSDGAGGTVRHAFVDGGVSTFNNPAFQLWLEATDPHYDLGWPTGRDRVLLVSVGTGFPPRTVPAARAARMTVLAWGPYAVAELMDDAAVQQDFLLRLLSGDAPAGGAQSRGFATVRAVDRAVEAVERAAPATPALTYRRYSTSFTRDRLDALGLRDVAPEGLERMDDPSRLADLRRVGEAVAREQVRLSDFPGFF